MDEAPFDQLARSVAGTSRRTALKTALGIALGGAMSTRLGAVMAAPAKRLLGDICRKHGDCASGRCGPRDATGRSRCICPGNTRGPNCAPSTITVTFSPTDNGNYCYVHVELTNFAPNTSYSGTYEASDNGDGPVGPLLTDADGNAGPTWFFSYAGLGRSLVVTIDGVSSESTLVNCAA